MRQRPRRKIIKINPRVKPIKKRKSGRCSGTWMAGRFGSLGMGSWSGRSETWRKPSQSGRLSCWVWKSGSTGKQGSRETSPCPQMVVDSGGESRGVWRGKRERDTEWCLFPREQFPQCRLLFLPLILRLFPNQSIEWVCTPNDHPPPRYTSRDSYTNTHVQSSGVVVVGKSHANKTKEKGLQGFTCKGQQDGSERLRVLAACVPSASNTSPCPVCLGCVRSCLETTKCPHRDVTSRVTVCICGMGKGLHEDGQSQDCLWRHHTQAGLRQRVSGWTGLAHGRLEGCFWRPRPERPSSQCGNDNLRPAPRRHTSQLGSWVMWGGPLPPLHQPLLTLLVSIATVAQRASLNPWWKDF